MDLLHVRAGGAAGRNHWRGADAPLLYTRDDRQNHCPNSANEPVPPVDSYEDWGDLEAFNDLFSDADLAEWEAEEQAAAAA
uniref:DUF695 domain-containing protein n=1 Tax=Steinernema glaseri TaxID=37863 RepID=A0A1I8A9U4_9BILA